MSSSGAPTNDQPSAATNGAMTTERVETTTTTAATPVLTLLQVGQDGLGLFGTKNPTWYECEVLQINYDNSDDSGSGNSSPTTLKVRWCDSQTVTSDLPIRNFRWNRNGYISDRTYEWIWTFVDSDVVDPTGDPTASASIHSGTTNSTIAETSTSQDYLSFTTWKLLYDLMVSKVVNEGLEQLGDAGDITDMDHWKRQIRSYLPKAPKAFVRFRPTESDIYDFGQWQKHDDEELMEGRCYYLNCVHSTNRTDSVDDFFRQVATPKKRGGLFRPFYNSNKHTVPVFSSSHDWRRMSDGDDEIPQILFCVPVDYPVGGFLRVKVLNVYDPFDFPNLFQQPNPCRGPIYNFRRTHLSTFNSTYKGAALKAQLYYVIDLGYYWKFLDHPTHGWYCYEWGVRGDSGGHRWCGYRTLRGQQQIEAFGLDGNNLNIVYELAEEDHTFHDYEVDRRDTFYFWWDEHI